MDKNTFLSRYQLLINKYEKLLSPFGQKVMFSLINIKNDGENKNSKCININPPARSRNKKVIIFNDSHDTSNLPITNNLNVNDEDETLHFQDKINDLPSVSTSVDLLKTLENKTSDLANKPSQVIENNVIGDNTACLSEIETNIRIDKEKTDVIQAPSKGISWNDIFDSKIFQDLDDSDEDIDKTITNSKLNTTQTNKKDVFMHISNTEVKQQYISDSCNENENNNKKRKNTMKMKPSKKVKTSEPKKTSTYRKEKYTKTVKNWLNDVDPTNAVEEDVLEHEENKSVYNFNCNYGEKVIMERNDTDDKNESSCKTKKQKRIVQAQLANKDGIMKFKKPNEPIKNGVNLDSEYTDNDININNVKETDKKLMSKSKEKKPKAPKFIAPIKSQIPVKDVTFGVIVVDDSNFDTMKYKLEAIVNGEIYLILVYSNGFCQVNSQHTDDACNPEGIMLRFNNDFYYLKGKINSLTQYLLNIMTNNRIIGYDVKVVLIYLLREFGLSLYDLNVVDVKIGASLINPDEPPQSFYEVQKLLEFTPSYTVATECILQKTSWYITLLNECADKLMTLLEENGLWKVFNDIEMQVLPIVAEMEFHGVAVDVEKLQSMEVILLNRMKEIEAECYKAAGKTFQINSTVQVRNILYDELKLDTKCNVKIRETICKGAKSTSESMLRSLLDVHPLPKLILEYRHLHKAHATFVSGIATQVRDGVVYPTWDQSAAATGRIASNNPNLQAIPKLPFSLVLFPEHDTGSAQQQSLNFREVYVAREGYELLAADFRHVECRVLAHAAADARLAAALAGADLFRELAAQWLSKPECEVSSEERERTKRLVYASLYGAGTRKLMEILNLGYDQVLSIMTSFNRTFPCLKSFGRSVVCGCARRGGRVATASGRARRLPGVGGACPAQRAHAERQAVNFIIQGAAADACKTAMARGARALRAAAAGARLLLQIHDELVWELPAPALHTAAGIVKEAMERSGPAGAHLPVALRAGRAWGLLRDYAP